MAESDKHLSRRGGGRGKGAKVAEIATLHGVVGRVFGSFAAKPGRLGWLRVGALVLLAGFPSLAQESTWLNASKLLVIGHAGSGFFTPINPFNAAPPSSWLGIRRALDQGADGVEVDLQLSQDSVLVLYHNTSLSSMTNAASGCVSTTPAATITRLRYRGGWPYDWLQREQPQRLDTVLARLTRRPGRFPLLHFDLHEADDCTGYNDGRRSRTLARQLVGLLARYQVPTAAVLVLTNQPATLRYFRALQPALPLGLEVTDSFPAGLSQARALGVQAVVLAKRVVTPERSAAVHAAGLQVVVFGGRSPRAIERLLASQPDAVEVDNVRQLLHQRRAAQRQLPAGPGVH